MPLVCFYGSFPYSPNSSLVDKSIVSMCMCVWRDGAEHSTRGSEMLRTLVVCWRASVVRDEEVGLFCKIVAVFIVTSGRQRFAVDTIDSWTIKVSSGFGLGLKIVETGRISFITSTTSSNVCTNIHICTVCTYEHT